MVPMLLKSILIVSMTLSIAYGSEIDSFTGRYLPLSDSKDIINTKANQAVEASLEKLKETGCDKKLLYQELRTHFNSIHKDGLVVDFILNSEEIEKQKILRKNSIYRHHRLIDGQILARPSADQGGFGMGIVINYNGYRIGSDKFEHMFGQGFRYFSGHYLKKKSLKWILTLGIFKEKTILGGNRLATGVFSFADLVANFQGMRFWNHILQENEDVLQENLGPYITCQNNEWKQVKEIDFSSYIDDGFDEAQNCLTLATAKAAYNVKKEISSLEENHSKPFNCPLNKEMLDSTKAKYNLVIDDNKNLSDYLFNPWERIRKIPFLWMP